MWKEEFATLDDYLSDEYGDDLRWFAAFDAKSYDYDVYHVRKDLQQDLKGNQLDYVIHRSLASFSKQNAEGVYFHLGDADHLVAGYERGSAHHVFLDDRRGLVVMLEPDTDVTLPEFPKTVREKARD
ncbi:hypothetical protein [Halarchaeum sp. P4]|uniref:hypothetical protein n=1 Tax=Halarchaeum sp. P4 TaxID=3421639 RepID=UPI003EBC0E7C